MTRLALTSDLHVDAHFGAINPLTGTTAREDDFLATTRWVANKALAFECEALVVAGDYVESKRVPPVDRVDRIRDALEAGPDRQIHIRGNHDIGRGREGTVMSLARHRGWSGYLEPGFELVGDVAVCVIPHLDRAWYRTQPGRALVPDADAYGELAETYLGIARGLLVAAKDAGARSSILVGHQLLRGGSLDEHQVTRSTRGRSRRSASRPSPSGTSTGARRSSTTRPVPSSTSARPSGSMRLRRRSRSRSSSSTSSTGERPSSGSRPRPAGT
jgi:hypothetical protein